MREIKFRGKGINSGQWFYGSAVTFGNKAYIFKMSRLLRMEHAEVVPDTVGQFTGLHDKDGKEIYEGDIIRSTRNGFGGVVKRHKRGYFYICEDIFEDDPDYNGDYANLGSMLENHPYFEVVGNISDNTPERLKGGEI